MTAMPRGKRGNLSLYIPLVTGRKQRSTGTADKARCKQLKAAVDWLASDRVRAFDVLEALCDGRVSFDECLSLSASGVASLAPLRQKLADVALLPHVEPFCAAWVADGKALGTVRKYRQYLLALMAVHPHRSDFTADAVREYMRTLTTSSGTRRKVLYCFRAFEQYLIEARVLSLRTLVTVPVPKKNKSRVRYESAETDARIVDCCVPKYRALYALIHATGADVSAAVAMTGRDLDLPRMQCHVPGTKSHRRDRHGVMIEAWAAPYVAALRTVLPAAPLFPDCTQNGASKHHATATRHAGVTDYTLRDARHSVAVRMRRRGASHEAIAQQLRTSVAQAVTTYSQFTADDMAAELAKTTTDLTTRQRTHSQPRREGHL
jgi:integrase